MPDVESVDDLYGLEPSEFTAARDRLARSLRKEGRRDEADEVAKLRRPSASVWAINALARGDLACVEAVFDAATRLRDALGDDAADLRAVQATYRDAVDAAVNAAAALTSAASDDMRTRIRTNLLAAAADEDLATRVRSGTLAGDQESPGFSSFPTVGPGRRLRAVPDPAPSTAEEPGDDTDRSAAEAARREATEAAERKLINQERRRLERELDRLRGRANRLATEADTIEERAAQARQAADRAARDVASAEDQLRRL